MIAGGDKVVKMRRREPFWFHSVRGINYFCYRYWWVVLILFVFLSFLFIRCLLDAASVRVCESEEVFEKRVNSIYGQLDSCYACQTSISPAPVPVPETDTASEIADELNRVVDSLGGKDGKITITLGWETPDDLDLYLVEPDGNVIFFDQSKRNSVNGGHLDIDMNHDRMDANRPVEHIYYDGQPPRGRYKIGVGYYQNRSGNPSVPYVLLVQLDGQTKQFNSVIRGPRPLELVYEFDY